MPKLVDHEIRRDRIAESEGRVQAVRGLEDLTLRDIAREEGCPPYILTHYFRDGSEVLAHASRHLGEVTLRRQLDSLASAESLEEAYANDKALVPSMNMKRAAQ